MPIRFRCAYCSQLMGISRRKAGTVVSCPKCHGQVVVPHPAPEDEVEPAAPGTGPQPLFEGADFDQVFNPSPGEAAAPQQMSPAVMAPDPGVELANAPAAANVGAHQEISFEVERFEPMTSSGPGAGRPGIWLTPTAITLLGLLMVVLLALAFVGGLLVGRSLGH
jgi:hypothetical protein